MVKYKKYKLIKYINFDLWKAVLESMVCHGLIFYVVIIVYNIVYKLLLLSRYIYRHFFQNFLV